MKIKCFNIVKWVSLQKIPRDEKYLGLPTFIIPFSGKKPIIVGFTNVTSHSGLQPYAVGDIFWVTRVAVLQ